jgi:enoyl-CoA hydratase/carnithine racemase
MVNYLDKNFQDIQLSLLDEVLGVLKITLNRPEASNAISDLMIDELCGALISADRDPKIRTIILTGAGKHFCAGGDLKAMKDKTGMFSGDSNELRQNYRYGIQRIPRTIENIDTPLIAQINGAAIGAGLDLACMCDIRVSSDKAKFGETFVKLGLIPGDGGGFFLQRVIGYPKAMELTLLGEVISAPYAKEIGLVNIVCAQEELDKVVANLSEKIAQNAPIAVSYAKKLVRSGYRQSVENHLEDAATYQGISQRTEDHFIGVGALLDKSVPKFNGN